MRRCCQGLPHPGGLRFRHATPSDSLDPFLHPQSSAHWQFTIRTDASLDGLGGFLWSPVYLPPLALSPFSFLPLFSWLFISPHLWLGLVLLAILFFPVSTHTSRKWSLKRRVAIISISFILGYYFEAAWECSGLTQLVILSWFHGLLLL